MCVCEQILYRVTVVTSDVKGAGTDANIDMCLEGVKGETGWYPLVSNGRDIFERAQVRGFCVCACMSTGARSLACRHMHMKHSNGRNILEGAQVSGTQLYALVHLLLRCIRTCACAHAPLDVCFRCVFVHESAHGAVCTDTCVCVSIGLTEHTDRGAPVSGSQIRSGQGRRIEADSIQAGRAKLGLE